MNDEHQLNIMLISLGGAIRERQFEIAFDLQHDRVFLRSDPSYSLIPTAT